jgi:hypothetical protein
MPLFDRKDEPENLTGDAATRALSVAAVENDFVEGVYDKLANVYDLIFGPSLHPGRLKAIQRMDIQPGERVLEVGVGTGINLSLYPREAAVTGIDFSSSMLEKARERAARKGAAPVRLLQMDAADLKFADGAFDIVRQAQTATWRAARNGVPLETLDAAARQVIVDAGYGPGFTYFTHRVGHGMGMDGHEWPYLVQNNMFGWTKSLSLQPGMVCSDEPGIYIRGEFGVRLEDTLHVTENGAELFTPQSESLEKPF